MVQGPLRIANTFNDYFATPGQMAVKILPSTISHQTYPKDKLYFHDHNWWNLNTNYLSWIENTKAIGICYLIYPVGLIIIKRSAITITINNISLPLTDLVSQALLTGIAPYRMKDAVISPIFKSGDSYKVQNYLITISCLTKILENVMHRRTYDFLNYNSILHDKPSGFGNS